ncbi:MAG TPA: aspartate aminotransferase family protein [Chitinophagaceae bacterium]|nr:aspartate aminotransferase family protein [Chitinophagaceae bacterium]
MTSRELFLRYLAQTSDAPIAFEVERAEGIWLYPPQGKPVMDLIGGISVCNTGHSNPEIIRAIEEQSKKYLHVMVYGETIQSPQIRYAQALCEQLPESLQSVYFTNSGSEATEGAMKLAKRYTGRTRFISFQNAYHGSTQGALSVMGSDYWKQAYRPLLPDVYTFPYNQYEVLDAITEECAAVLVEPILSEAGADVPDTLWLKALREQCTRSGTLLIFDEIQNGFGRTGSLFRFQAIGVIPDILLLGKALGGGLPMGAFISSQEIMNQLSFNPVLGHITTFGGHPLCCAAGLASFQFLLNHHLTESVEEKEKLFRRYLSHPAIRNISGKGLHLAIHFEDAELNKKIITTCLSKGVFSDWFLFAPQAMRLAPPLIINAEEIKQASSVIIDSIDTIWNEQ